MNLSPVDFKSKKLNQCDRIQQTLRRSSENHAPQVPYTRSKIEDQTRSFKNLRRIVKKLLFQVLDLHQLIAARIFHLILDI